jgi:hypothetical protein
VVPFGPTAEDDCHKHENDRNWMKMPDWHEQFDVKRLMLVDF